jgi:hypothetical protein
MAAKDSGACGTHTKELAAPEVRGSHAQNLPPARGGAFSVEWGHSWQGSDRRH